MTKYIIKLERNGNSVTYSYRCYHSFRMGKEVATGTCVDLTNFSVGTGLGKVLFDEAIRRMKESTLQRLEVKVQPDF